MDIYESIADKKNKLAVIIKDKSTSKVLKHFIDEIIILNKTFSKTEQISILENKLEIKIKYQTYNSFFRRNVLPKLENSKDK